MLVKLREGTSSLPYFLGDGIMGERGTINNKSNRGKTGGNYHNVGSLKQLKAYRASLDKKARGMLREVEKQAKEAQQRINKLTKAGFDTTPAMDKILKSNDLINDKGQITFSVKGKKYQDLQRTFYQLERFNRAQTSSVEGARKNLKVIMTNIGLEYKANKTAIQESTVFFEVASKIQQYLEAQENYGEALAYQRIWTAIRNEVEIGKITLNKAMDSEEIAHEVLQQLNIVLREIEEVDELTEFLGGK